MAGTPTVASGTLQSIVEQLQQAAGRPTLGPATTATSLPPENKAWLGVNMASAPEDLRPLESPWCNNVESFARRGCLTSRRAFGRLSAVATDNKPVISAVPLYVDENGVQRIALVSDNGDGSANLEFVALQAEHAPLRPLRAKPQITLTSPASETLRVAIPALSPNVGVDYVVVRYSQEGYPRSPTGKDYAQSGLGAAYPWSGASGFAVDIADLEGDATYFVSVWLASKLGWSDRARGEVLIQA